MENSKGKRMERYRDIEKLFIWSCLFLFIAQIRLYFNFHWDRETIQFLFEGMVLGAMLVFVISFLSSIKSIFQKMNKLISLPLIFTGGYSFCALVMDMVK